MHFRANRWLLYTALLSSGQVMAQQSKQVTIKKEYTTGEEISDHKLRIYQLMVRLFGNKQTTNKYYGDIRENGCGKFDDINDNALKAIKDLGISHVWYTGVVEHATMSDYTRYGISKDHPAVVKGRAGSPYAIKDYYDVDPDLANNVPERMSEFQALVKRTHAHGLKVLIDFVPNHVARTYYSDVKPSGVTDFGTADDTTQAFSPCNDFYYIPGTPLILPPSPALSNLLTAGVMPASYEEHPAKATGNNVFSAQPKEDDWYETIKLNYGVDYAHGEKGYFDPIPPVWLKMKDILVYWAQQDVDGFRCDMAEMVPVAFWQWVIPAVKAVKPDIIFIAEAYNPRVYKEYLDKAGFNYLYDKVGLYDGLKRLIRNEPQADVNDIRFVWQQESRGYGSRMLRFLENHDEERIASTAFAGNAWLAKPAMVITATLGSGPVMIYAGQESGERGSGKEGFNGDDGRSTIFDYWGMPQHQAWMNGGAFDGGKLTADQQRLRTFYNRLLQLTGEHEAIRQGSFYEITNDALNKRQYAYLRYSDNKQVLIVANFDRKAPLTTTLMIPAAIQMKWTREGKNQLKVRELLTDKVLSVKQLQAGIPVNVPPGDAWICDISYIQ
ncbi:alpha-amylase family protein [Chitinophaga sp. MD30]|uniref:alpha-amylase family protein n=1 Tax=Chitinophaga sp. MD30 TaxID=2033437 RepID=UPI0018DFDD9D|nr:alpha-amylase family protein [Chitinophaga sp. MD30]